MRLDPDLLIEAGLINRVPPNNATHWIYGRGDNCDHVLELPVNESTLWCPLCSLESITSQLRKVYTVPPIKLSMPAHFNYAVGEYVSNPAQFESALSRKSDETAERLGMDVKLQRIDPRDAAPDVGVTSKGLEDTYRTRHDAADPGDRMKIRKAEREAERRL